MKELSMNSTIIIFGIVFLTGVLYAILSHFCFPNEKKSCIKDQVEYAVAYCMVIIVLIISNLIIFYITLKDLRYQRELKDTKEVRELERDERLFINSIEEKYKEECK